MSTKRVYMDQDMLESYSSYNVAADSFLDSIALENIGLDTTLQLEFNIYDDDLFSNYACEAIGETVKNMASKAKSNFVTYAKKLVNFLFGWLIKFFKGSANVKQTMAKSYTKAKDYLKKLNELERKARGADKEEQIEITDYGNCIVVGLFMMQAIMISAERLGKGMSEAYNETKSSGDNGEDGKKLSTMRGFKLLDRMLDELAILFATVGSIEINKTNELVSKLRSNNFNVTEVMAGYAGSAENLKNKTMNANESFGFEFLFSKDKGAESPLNSSSSEQTGKSGAGANDNHVKDGKNEEDDKNVKLTDAEKKQNKADQKRLDKKGKATSKLENTYKERLEDTANYMTDPDKSEMSLTDAFDELRGGLNMFMNISKNNKWDLEKHIKAAEKIRRGIEKELNSMSVTNVNDKVVSDLLTRILKVGNHLGQVERSAGVVVKRISACIDGMTTDVAKLGSRLVKIGETD